MLLRRFRSFHRSRSSCFFSSSSAPPPLSLFDRSFPNNLKFFSTYSRSLYSHMRSVSEKYDLKSTELLGLVKDQAKKESIVKLQKEISDLY